MERNEAENQLYDLNNISYKHVVCTAEYAIYSLSNFRSIKCTTI